MALANHVQRPLRHPDQRGTVTWAMRVRVHGEWMKLMNRDARLPVTAKFAAGG